MRRPTKTSLRPCLDALESRTLMAGNVAVRFDSGDVVITGDGSSNAIEIYQVSLDRYRVVGKSAGGSATKINNITNGSFDFVLNSVYFDDDLRIEMKGGNDSVTIRGDAGLFGFNDIDIPGTLAIEMGSGDDRVSLQYVETWRGDIRIDVGTDVDTVSVSDTVAADDLRVLKPSTSTSKAVVNLNRVTARSELEVSLGEGADVVNINDSWTKDLVVRLRKGNDRINIRRSTVARNWHLHGGDGSDRLNRYLNNQFLGSEAFESYSTNNSDF